MQPRLQAIRPKVVLLILAALAIVAVAAFMLLGAKGSWAFVLKFRGIKLVALLLVAYSIAVSTILFQTVTNNRILTPSIMGFDALYILIQTSLVFVLGSTEVNRIDPQLRFLAEVAAMILFAWLLYRWLFNGATRSLHLLMLVGIIFGVFFRSLSNFMQRVLDPNEFMVLQDSFFASFNTVHTNLLALSTGLVLLASLVGWRIMHTFDVLALGRDPAINLGVDHKRMVNIILVLAAVMVSISTALVGPVTFFGLLVANLAYQIAGTNRHRIVLPVAVLLAVICLVGGQVILERIFAFDTALSIIIEFLGGLVFILLLIRGTAR
ncbi:MAG: iron chelate uptake ABC transporter family permease subunit [Phyllobacterium sp.]